MWTAVLGGVVALVIATQTVQTRACDPEATPAPAPAPSPTPTPVPAPAPAAETFTTSDGVRFTVQSMVTGLEIPWSMAFAPDGRLFVTERPGRVRIIDAAFGSSELALTMDDVFAQGEAGLLGIALEPEFTANRFVYLYYSARLASGGAVNRVVRYREVNSRLGERAVILDNIPAATIHDGGRIRFGPDGLLYVTAGDAANTALAQDLSSLAGKILRVNRDGTTPRTNPFGGPIYSSGHRNPQGLDWHPGTGELWASEHGNSGNDEINVIDGGANYGWPRIEGAGELSGMRTPISHYSPSIAPSGASFYRGQRFPRFVNNLFVGTLAGSHLLRIVPDGSARRIASQERLLNGRFGRIRDVASGPDGLLYFLTNNRDGRGAVQTGDDRLARLVPAS